MSSMRNLFAGLLVACALATCPIHAQAQTGPGYALAFDGSDSVSVAHQSVLNAYPMTLTAWVQTSQNDSSFRGIVAKSTLTPTNGFALSVRNGHVWGAYARSPLNYILNGTDPLDGGIIADGSWHHVALVVDASGGRLYVDGLLRASHSWTGTAGACTLTSDLLLGRYVTATLTGTLDEVSLWNVASSQAEIQRIMSQGLVGAEPGLLGYWRMNSSSGTTASNSAATGAAFAGTLQSSPTWVLSGMPFLPEATTVPALNLTMISASLRGTVNPANLPTTAWFRWGLTASYGSNTTAVNLGAANASLELTNSLAGLIPNTLYHYCVMASNRAGINAGDDRTFSTLPVPSNILVTSTNNGSGSGTLREAIALANTYAGPHTITLPANAVFRFAGADNYWYGPNALPPIASDITIEGNGAMIERATNSSAVRLFYVGADPASPATSGYNSPGPGRLTLRRLTLRNGWAQGGNSYGGGGGGAGLGGAIFNQGTVLLDTVLLNSNVARGGEGGSLDVVANGGGMGEDATYFGGGGFGGAVTPAGSMGAGGGGGFRATDSASSTNGGGVRTGLGGSSRKGRDGNGSGGGFIGGGGFGLGGLCNTNSPVYQDGGGGGVGGGGGSSIGTLFGSGEGGGGGFGGGGAGFNGAGGFGGGGGGTQYPVMIGAAGRGGFGGGWGMNPGSVNGQAFGGGGAGMGGAIFNHNGSLIVTNCTFVQNEAWGGTTLGDPGSSLGGAIFNLNGTVTILSSTLRSNLVNYVGDGGAVYNLGYESATSRTATLVLSNSVLADNLVPAGGVDLFNHRPDSTAADTNVATALLQITAPSTVALLTNSGGVLPAWAPVADPVVASVIRTNPAGSLLVQLTSSISPNGRDTVAFFQYGLGSSYAGVTPGVSFRANYNSNFTVSASVDGLLPGMNYNFRTVASNSFTITHGPGLALDTPALFPPGDLNADGKVDQNELNAVLGSYWPNSPWVEMTQVASGGVGAFQFVLTNSSSWQFSVQASTDLLTWVNLPIPAYPSWNFADPAATNYPQRYYRLRWP